jgi:predicted dithiol-disulfide oxidoreductase (DUF899 family)
LTELLRDPNVRFPGESSEYRQARNQLLAAEEELKRRNEEVAAQRRALPAGGLLKEDYVFESATDGGVGTEVRFSELFAPGKHRWAAEMIFANGDSKALDPIWPIFGALDLTPDGRGDGAAYPNLRY